MRLRRDLAQAWDEGMGKPDIDERRSGNSEVIRSYSDPVTIEQASSFDFSVQRALC
jgi:hypothetical protein